MNKAFVDVPKDLSRIQPKVMFGLTKRQVICFGAGVVLGLPLFFLLRGAVGVSTAALVMILAMLPFFLLGMYEKDGQPLEKVLGNAIHSLFLREKQRPYQTDNFYAALMRQAALDKEVHHIVRKAQTTKAQAPQAQAHPQRKKANRKAGRAGKAQ